MTNILSRSNALACVLILLGNPVAFAQIFTEDFDDLNAASRWTAFSGAGFDINAGVSEPPYPPLPVDTNFDRLPATPTVDGVNDDFSGFAFDYSTVGIPSAPNSEGGTTIGMKLQTNLFSNVFGGFSASPNGLSLTGDYTVSFDAWSNTVGPFPSGGSGSTNLSTFGILTAASASQALLTADGVFFAYTADANSSADVRAYSIEDQNSYDGTAAEPHATYYAGTRNIPIFGGAEQLYLDAFGTDRSAPQLQIDTYGPGGTNQADQTGMLAPGAPGFAWHHHEIVKTGNIIDWIVNGHLLITVDMTNFAIPTAGGNISFGHSDINASSSTVAARNDLLFTLIDNVSVVPEPMSIGLLTLGFGGLFSIRPRKMIA